MKRTAAVILLLSVILLTVSCMDHNAPANANTQASDTTGPDETTDAEDVTATDGTENALPETTDAATSASETTEPGTGEPATEAVTEAPAGLEETLKQAYADLCYNAYYKDKDPGAVFDRDAVRVEIIYEKDGSVVFYGRGGEPFASTGDTVVKYCGGYIFCLPNQNTVRLYDNGTLLELFSAYEQGHIT
ncbi:MAG: hypothetical protein J6330_11295, partial [Clostridia bacterium]|nr:hypothetical protein [Clostridia bacterium]